MSLGIDIGTAGIKIIGSADMSSDADRTVLSDAHVLSPYIPGPETTADGPPTRLGPDMQMEIISRVGGRIPCVYGTADTGFVSRPAHEVFAGQAVDLMRKYGKAGRAGSGYHAYSDPPPSTLAIPAWWSTRAVRLVSASLARAGFGETELVPGPELSVRGVDGVRQQGDPVLVVDLGASTATTSIVEWRDERFAVNTSTVGTLRRAGFYLDRRVLRHFMACADAPELADPDNDESVRRATSMLDHARSAKETLSRLTAVTVADLDVSVRMVRSEFDELCEPWLRQILQLVQASLRNTDAQVETVLLVGGSSMIPAVAQRLSAELGHAVVVDDDPTMTTAKGAAYSARSSTKPARSGIRRWFSRPQRRQPAQSSSHSPALPAGPSRHSTEPAPAESPLSIFGIDYGNASDKQAGTRPDVPLARPRAHGDTARTSQPEPSVRSRR